MPVLQPESTLKENAALCVPNSASGLSVGSCGLKGRSDKGREINVATNRSPFRRKWVEICFAILGSIGLAAFILTPGEPSHDGKTISQWLEVAEDYSATDQYRAIADEAIREIGLGAVPSLLKKLKSDDRYRKPVANVWNGFANRVLPSAWYGKFYMKGQKAYDHHQQAQHGFRIIGTNADVAVPELSKLLFDPTFATNTARCLIYIRTQDALRAFASGLTNSDPSIRDFCLDGMAAFSYEALKPFTQRIKLLTDDTNEFVAASAMQMVWGLLEERELTELSLPKLKDKRVLVQRRAIYNLFFTEAPMAAIAECFSSPDLKNRILATNALLSINPYFAPQYGVFTNGASDSVFTMYQRRIMQAQTDAAARR
jgi:hypothetical protein